MEKYLQKIEFALVLAFLVLPPIFFQAGMEAPKTATPSFSAQTYALALLAFFIYYIHRNVYIIRFQKKWTKMQVFIASGECLVCFGSLCVVSVLLELAGYLLGESGEIQKAALPHSLNSWVVFISGMVCAAFYEEVVYRFYLPEAMRHLFSRFPKIPQLALEAVAVALFALGHIYLGALGFLNAAICGTILRLFVWRTHSLWCSLIPHALYNFCVYFALANI